MSKAVLVTGSQQRVGEVSARLQASGAQVIEVTDLAALPMATDGRQIDCYIQLPGRTTSQGETVIARVRDFLASGLLERFRAVETVLPKLSYDGVVVLVAGNLPDQASAPDDQQARLSLLRVLGRAVQAEVAPAHVRVAILRHDATPEQIVERALGTGPAWRGSADDLAASGAEMRYEDWRAEIIGLAYVES
jgi:hypothetical protein